MNEACFFGWREQSDGDAAESYVYAPVYVTKLTGPVLYRHLVWVTMAENGCHWADGMGAEWTFDSCSSNFPHDIGAPMPMVQRQNVLYQGVNASFVFKLGSTEREQKLKLGWDAFTERSGMKHWKTHTAAQKAGDLQSMVHERYDLPWLLAHSNKACDWSVYHDGVKSSNQRHLANPHMLHRIGHEYASVASIAPRKGLDMDDGTFSQWHAQIYGGPRTRLVKEILISHFVLLFQSLINTNVYLHFSMLHYAVPYLYCVLLGALFVAPLNQGGRIAVCKCRASRRITLAVSSGIPPTCASLQPLE